MVTGSQRFIFVLMLAMTAIFVMVLLRVFGHRQVPPLPDAQGTGGLDGTPVPPVADTQGTGGLDGRPVPYSPSLETISSKEHSGTGLLSINLVVIPYLHYNTTDERILEREEEYKTCLKRNLNHDLISRVHVLTTNAQKTLQHFKDLPNQNKLIVSEVKSVDLARDPWEYISQNLVGKDVMFANADIYLGGGFDRVDALLMSRQKIMYPLTRRGAREEKCGMADYCLDKPYIGSHDVFLFRLIEPLPEQFFKELEFGLVSLGMENIVIGLFQNMLKYCTLNPCTILETFHFHCSNLRSNKGRRVNTAGKSGLSGFTKKLVCST